MLLAPSKQPVITEVHKTGLGIFKQNKKIRDDVVIKHFSPCFFFTISVQMYSVITKQCLSHERKNLFLSFTTTTQYLLKMSYIKSLHYFSYKCATDVKQMMKLRAFLCIPLFTKHNSV